MEKTTFDTSGQSVQKSPEGLFLQDGIAGLRSLPRHSVDMPRWCGGWAGKSLRSPPVLPTISTLWTFGWIWMRTRARFQ